MSENFEIIKKKYFVTAIIAGIVLGICGGVALTCVLAVILKQCAVNFLWALYIPVAVVLSAGLSAAFFFILRPTDLKIAKKLDNDFALNQKVQTMVEYRSAEGAMPQLQREQTEAVLGEVAKKRVDLKWLLKFLFIPVIAVAMLFAGIFVPANKSTNDPPFNVTENQIMLLTKLIEDVETSELQDGVKTPAVATLNSLLDGLKREQPQSVMKAAVISSVKVIDNLVASTNSYQKLYNTLKDNSDLTSLAGSLVNGATFFKTGGAQIATMAAVNSTYMTADNQVENALLRWQMAFLRGYEEESEAGEETQYLPVSEASEKLGAYASALQSRLSSTQYANQTENVDGLYGALAALQAEFEYVAGNTKNMGDAGYNGKIAEGCSNFVSAAVSPLMVQSYSLMMDEYIRNSLANIFRISRSEFGDSSAITTNPNQDDVSGSTGGNESGGYGKGELKYGSDDLILNVGYGSDDSAKQVPYGEVLSTYNEIVNELIRQGACSEEVAEYLRQYFRLLYSGIEED